MERAAAEYDVIVAGAGAAGLLAAIRARERGRRVVVLEKNTKPGAKILMSGGTRCNVTQSTDPRGIADAFGAAGKFLLGPLTRFGPDQVIDLLAEEGVATKVESTNKVFPASDSARDVQAALVRRARRLGAIVATGEPIVEVVRHGHGVIVRTTRRRIASTSLILATGGRSYPGCGTTGDGYAWAARLGHTISTPRPALVPIEILDAGVRAMKGLSVADVAVTIVDGARELSRSRGGLLFTHFGLSGPAVLDVSRAVSTHPTPASLEVRLDLAPTLGVEELSDSIADATRRGGAIARLLPSSLPVRLREELALRAAIPAPTQAGRLRRHQRRELASVVKSLRLAIAGTLGFNKAEVTAGGVTLSEIDSRSMRSRTTPQLLLAGEILDVDGPIGGYNFQAAFSTGWVAGDSA